MDTRSLELYEITSSEELDRVRRLTQDNLELLTEEEANVLKDTPRADRRVALAQLRKGRNRNEPCPCGSGKKVKNCCKGG